MFITNFVLIALIGICATAMLDIWLLLLKRVGIPTGSIALIGRWVAHMGNGKFIHKSIAKSAPLRDELFIGWVTHYAVGVAFACVLIAIQGISWIEAPTFMPAFLIGLATVVMPLFIMQPAMGMGFAASKTATPLRNCIRSIVNHSIFGVGMYITSATLSKLIQ